MFFKKKEGSTVTLGQALGIIIGTVALCISIGAARWSWFLVEELILLRQDFNELRSQQEQLKIQFDFWDNKVSEERAMIRKMRGEMTNVNGARP